MADRLLVLTQSELEDPAGVVRVPFGDLGARSHHPRCPSHPGEPLGGNAVCCDCVYGVLAEREGGK